MLAVDLSSTGIGSDQSCRHIEQLEHQYTYNSLWFTLNHPRSVHVFLPVSKPRPPSDLVYTQKVNNDAVVFGLNFSPNHAYSGRQEALNLTYKVRTRTHRSIDPFYWEYACEEVSSAVDDAERKSMDLPVEKYVEHKNGYRVAMEVAAVYKGVVSEYVSFPENGTGESCKIPVQIGEYVA